jgi:hypothetical protein
VADDIDLPTPSPPGPSLTPPKTTPQNATAALSGGTSVKAGGERSGELGGTGELELVPAGNKVELLGVGVDVALVGIRVPATQDLNFGV